MSRISRHNRRILVLLGAVIFIFILGEVRWVAYVRYIQDLANDSPDAFVSVLQG